MAEIINVELEQEVELQTSYELSGGIIPTGTINITTNGTHDVTTYASANVNVQGGITPTGTKEIEVDAAGTITEDVTNYASVEVTVPQGQYKPNIDATPTNPSISVSNGGLITAEVMTQYVNDLLKPSFTEGYVKSSDVSMKVKIGGSATQQLNTVNGQTVTPTTSTQYIAVQGDYVLGAINVAPIPSQYIIPTGTKSISANGTGIDVTQYASVDVNVSGGIDFTDYVKQSATFPSGAWTYTGTTLRDYAMAYVRDNPEWQFYAPNLTYIGQNALREAQNLTEVHMPSLTSYHATTYFCYKCPKLTLLDLGFINITSNMFAYSAKLNTLILRKTTVATLNNVNAFAGTPFANGGSGGTIYIPKVLYDHLGDGSSSDYQHATNWSTVYGYGTVTWKSIENSTYENYYADGTPVS